MKVECKTIPESESMSRMQDYIERNAAHIEDNRERQKFRDTWARTLAFREARLSREPTS